MFSFVRFAAECRSPQCFPVIIALSDFTIWSFGPCCAICLPALGNPSCTHSYTQTKTMPVLPWEQPGDRGEQSGQIFCCTLWLTFHTFMCWTKLPSWTSNCKQHAKTYSKCVNNTDRGFMHVGIVVGMAAITLRRKTMNAFKVQL